MSNSLRVVAQATDPVPAISSTRDLISAFDAMDRSMGQWEAYSKMDPEQLNTILTTAEEYENMPYTQKTALSPEQAQMYAQAKKQADEYKQLQTARDQVTISTGSNNVVVLYKDSSGITAIPIEFVRNQHAPVHYPNTSAGSPDWDRLIADLAPNGYQVLTTNEEISPVSASVHGDLFWKTTLIKLMAGFSARRFLYPNNPYIR